MTEKPDELFNMLGRLRTPDLDPAFAARVRAGSLAEFARSAAGAGSFEPRLAQFGRALVPALLLSAAAVRLMELVHVATHFP